MSNWFMYDPIGLYREFTNLNDFPEGIIGFVYKVTNIQSGKFYIGKKALHHLNKKILTKKEIAEWAKPGRVPKKLAILKESDWKTYYGSNKHIKEELKTLGPELFTREVIQLCKSKKQLSYYEVSWQMKLDVLAIDSYNDNVAGKFYRKDLE